jgi:hypothetical protein
MKLIPLTALIAVLFAGSAAASSGSCRVADPTGTPLNIRLSPSGKIVGQIENGMGVTITDRATDDKGARWVHVVQHESGAEIGWVFERYLNCR